MAPRLLAAGFACIALLAASCGDDDDGESQVDDVYFGAVETRPASAEDGLEVVRVEANSPVSSSGLRRDDIITAVEGESVHDPEELETLLDGLAESYDAGDKVEISATRGSRQQTYTVRLAANVYVGAQLLAPRAGETGARVGAVPGGTPADAARLRRDDLITAVDGGEVSSSNDFIRALAGHGPGDEIELSVRRGSQELAVTLSLQPRG